MTTILYDLPSKGRCACWSLNPWKTRLALNYKGIPYKTQWVEYPDIADLQKNLSIPPNAPPAMPHTIPAITLPEGTSMQDSQLIATKLEALQPNPPMHLDAPILLEVEALITKIREAFAPVIMPCVPRNVLNPRSAEYFERTRAERFGMPLSELEKRSEGAWEAVAEPLVEVAGLLKREKGPFFMGGEVSYADFVMVGFLQFCRKLSEEIFERVVAMDVVLGDLYKACEVWLKRDGD